MNVKTIIEEDLVNYKKPSMFIGTVSCGGKCCLEAGIPISVCQNDEWRSKVSIYIDDNELCERYLNNPLTKAIVFGGLEPFEQFDEILHFIEALRNEYRCNDDVVIYTGYTEDEVRYRTNILAMYKNIIVKFGRYIPDRPHRFDEILGVELVSDNQYAKILQNDCKYEIIL